MSDIELRYAQLQNELEETYRSVTELTNELELVAKGHLQKARLFAETIVDTMRDPLVVLNRDLTIVSVSHTFLRTYGVTLEEVKGQNICDLSIGHWDIPTLRHALERIFVQGSTVEGFQVEHILPTAGRRVMLLNARKMQLEDYGTELILLVIEDITDRRAMEDALKSSEARIRGVMDNVVDGVVTIDERGRIESFSQSAQRIFQYSEDEVRGQNVKLLMPEPYHSEHDGYIDSYLRTGKSKTLGIGLREVIGQRKDGTTVALELSLSDMFVGDNRVFIGALRDITDRKRAAAELRSNEARFRGIVENSPSAIFLKDLEGRFLLVNRKFEEWYGCSAAEARCKTSYDIYPKQYADTYAAQDRDVLATLQAIERELDVPFADGTLHKMIVTKFPVVDSFGKTLGVGTINTDVSEHRSAEAQLYQAQKMEAVGQLTGGVAHDFNNLLTVILGNLQLVGRSNYNDAKLQKRVETAIHAATRAADLTRRLLAFSRRQVLEPRVVQPNDLISGMNDLLRRSLGEVIEIRMHLEADLWHISVDPAQMESVLLNLAINARDAMPDGGTLTIETAKATVGEDYVTAHPYAVPGDYVILAVSDMGTGMSKEVLEHVFEPFFSTKEVGKGTGLGLSMVYGFVKQSGGHVSIYSEERRGTSVKIYLPRTDSEEQASLETTPTSENLPVGTETILVVEDQPEVRETAVALLESLGYRLLVAENGQAALAVLDQHPDVDVLFTDLVMPGGIDGLQLAQKVRERNSEIRILYTSGYTEHAALNSESLDRDGHWIAKPYLDTQLARKIREVVSAPGVTQWKKPDLASIGEFRN